MVERFILLLVLPKVKHLPAEGSRDCLHFIAGTEQFHCELLTTIHWVEVGIMRDCQYYPLEILRPELDHSCHNHASHWNSINILVHTLKLVLGNNEVYERPGVIYQRRPNISSDPSSLPKASLIKSKDPEPWLSKLLQICAVEVNKFSITGNKEKNPFQFSEIWYFTPIYIYWIYSGRELERNRICY